MPDAARWGVDSGYEDVTGQWRQPPPSTIETFLEIMGATDDSPPPGPAIIVAPGRPEPQLPPGEVQLEDGAVLPVDGAMPDALPMGYHRYIAGDGRSGSLIVSPGRCWFPPGLRSWGWAAQLYATRSHDSWGIGDLADLRSLCRWSAGQGAGIALINPLHAAPADQPSPYFASSRCFRNPLYLRIEELPGAERLADLAELAAAGRALNGERLIDRVAVWRLKSVALEALYADFPGDPAFDRYLDEAGTALRGYATFCALSERFDLPWENWPAAVRRPDAPGIAPFADSREGAERIRYHAWLQWLIDGQLRSASDAVALIQDLAIGADAGGADAWRWQDSTAVGVRVGAPPDEFNVTGQDWGLPPFDPWRLRSSGYQPFVELLRAGLRHAGGLRFDHVMGLFRLYWIPAGASPAEGTYVRYPAEDLLDILALESHRAKAYIVGEDLGTVDESHRWELSARGVLSYRLLWFESTPPGSGQWPHQALAAATTHDLPTVAGMWTNHDLKARCDLDLHPNIEAEEALRAKVAGWIGSDDDAPPEEAIERVYQLLGQAPCALITAPLDDALAVEERPNMPGTIDEWPNWRLALPAPLEELEACKLAQSIAHALNERGESPSAST